MKKRLKRKNESSILNCIVIYCNLKSFFKTRLWYNNYVNKIIAYCYNNRIREKKCAWLINSQTNLGNEILNPKAGKVVSDNYVICLKSDLGLTVNIEAVYKQRHLKLTLRYPPIPPYRDDIFSLWTVLYRKRYLHGGVGILQCHFFLVH